jgi:hypothetical protein
MHINKTVLIVFSLILSMVYSKKNRNFYRGEDMNTLEFAQLEDWEICNQIINAGRDFQKEQGFVQWTDDYPNKDTIYNDIKNKKGYVVKVDGVLLGICA